MHQISCATPLRKPFTVHPWSHPIETVGFPTGVPGDRSVHSKFCIIDSSLVLTGSFNWSNAGNFSNDETLIAIDNPLVAAHYEREFDRLYSTAALGLKTLPNAVDCNTIQPPEPKSPKPHKPRKPRKSRKPRTKKVPLDVGVGQ